MSNNNLHSLTNDNFNDISNLTDTDYTTLITTIKLTLLRLKLNLLCSITTHHIKHHFLHFLSKASLKISLESLFKHSDNFLYFSLNDSPSKYKTFYISRKLTYVLKSFTYRHNFLLRNAFALWKQQTNVISLILLPKKESKRKQECFNFISTLTKIFTQHQANKALYMLLMFKWIIYSKHNDIRNAKIKRASFILQNVFNRTFSYVFAMLPCNYQYIRTLSNKICCVNCNNNNNDLMYHALLQYKKEQKEMTLLIKKTALLKVLLKQNLKLHVNKTLYNAFRKMKFLTETYTLYEQENTNLNEILLDLKCDSLLNGILLLKLLLTKHDTSMLMVHKQIFFTKLRTYVQLQNTLHEYAMKYKQIPQLLNKQSAVDILLIRNEYKKAYALMRICIMRTKYKYINTTPYTNKALLQLYLKCCFYQWKGLICSLQKHQHKQQFAMNLMYHILCQKFYYNIRYMFISNLITYATRNKFNAKYRRYFALNLCYEIQKCFMNRKVYVFYVIVNGYHDKIYGIVGNVGNILARRMYVMRCRCEIRNIRGVFGKWRKIGMEVNMRSNCNEFDVPLENNNNNNNNEEEEHVDVVEEEEEEKENENENEYLIFANASYRRLSSLIPLITIKHKHSYKIYFTKWKDITRSYMHSSRIRTSSSSHINQMIINNMSTVLLTCENDLSKLKSSLRINTILIRLIITKHNMTMLTYISKWLRNSYTQSNYTALMSQYENLKKENDNLIEVYYDKKNQYKKTIADYEYMKKHYCNECMGEDVDVDYKSVDKEDNVNEDASCDDDNEDDDDSELMHIESEDECNRVHINNNTNMNNTNVNKIAEKEMLIKEYQNEYNQQQKYYEEYINTMNKKKEELLAMKQMLLQQAQSQL